MMKLAPMPPVNNVAFSGGGPGDLSQPWTQYLVSLDTLIRASALGGAALQSTPNSSLAAIIPATGEPTHPWRLYWNARDVILRASGWTIGAKSAGQALKPLPPTLGFSMVFGIAGTLTLPWAQYFSSVDALARPQSD